MAASDFQLGEPRPQSKREKRLQDERIRAMYKRGITSPSALAEFFDLTPQRIGQIIRAADAVAVEPLSPEDAEREIRWALAALDQVIADYAREYQRLENGGYRLGAIRGRRDAIMERLELQARAGILPKHLAQPAQAAQTAALIQEFAAALKRHNASDEMLREVHEIAVRAAGRRVQAIEVAA